MPTQIFCWDVFRNTSICIWKGRNTTEIAHSLTHKSKAELHLKRQNSISLKAEIFSQLLHENGLGL